MLRGGLAFSPKKIFWRDIDDFFILDLTKGGKVIGFNYTEKARESAPMAKFSKSFGADGALPRGWTLSLENVVAELNAFRLRDLAARNAAAKDD